MKRFRRTIVAPASHPIVMAYSVPGTMTLRSMRVDARQSIERPP
jgi:hypothetical protein